MPTSSLRYRYNRLSYAIALSLEATRRTLAAARHAFDRAATSGLPALPEHDEPCNDACGAGCPNAPDPRDWTCTCGTVNPSFDPWCSRCEEPRPEPAGPDYGDARMAEAAAAAAKGDPFETDPEPPRTIAAECGEEPDTRRRICPNCFAALARSVTKCDVCGVTLTRLRDRVRAKPLTVADIVEGASYTPKRGNNKTPNYFVAAIAPGGHEVAYYRTNETCGVAAELKRATMAEFLALVARKADA